MKTRAYTLIELLVSMLVFMILFILLMTFFSSMLGLTSRETTKAQAIYDGNAVLNQIKSDLHHASIVDYKAASQQDFNKHLSLDSSGGNGALRFFAYASNNAGTSDASMRLMAISYKLIDTAGGSKTLMRYCLKMDTADGGNPRWPGDVAANWATLVETPANGTVMTTGVTEFSVSIYEFLNDVSGSSGTAPAPVTFADAPLSFDKYPFGMTVRLKISADSKTAHQNLRDRDSRQTEIFFTFPAYFDQFYEDAYSL